jgi:hypothetical protein
MGHRPSLLSKLTASTHRLDAAVLQSEVEKLTHCTLLSKICCGENVTVAGRIRSVVYTPREHVPTLEAELFDGSDSVTLVWLGRRRIAGIEPGRRLIARGRVGDHDGPAICNPWYELQATTAS